MKTNNGIFLIIIKTFAEKVSLKAKNLKNGIQTSAFMVASIATLFTETHQINY